MTSRIAFHEAGHVLVGVMTGRKVVEVWVRGKEGRVEFEPFRWFPGGVARIRRRLAVDVAGCLAEDLAAGVDRGRLSRRLAGGYSGPVQPDDRSSVRKAWAIRTGELLDDYHAERVFWRQAAHGRHEDILAEVVRAERRAHPPAAVGGLPEAGARPVPAPVRADERRVGEAAHRAAVKVGGRRLMPPAG
jgi:hypothetical protein